MGSSGRRAGEPILLLDDNPTVDDKLGLEPTADIVHRVIVGASARPLTIGVFGGWGSGKTSIMKMVEARFERHAEIRTVWFNAWKYNGREVIWNALIQTVFQAMKDAPGAETDGRASAFLRRVLHASRELTKYAAKVGTRFVPGGVLREEDVDAMFETLGWSADDELFEFINRFEETFDSLVKDWVGDHGYLILFIDDLDRCLPENAIEVLEALKLYLDSSHCVFVVGVDPRVIEEAIRRRYGDNRSLPPSEYLEKIIQVPIVVPRLRSSAALDLAAGRSSHAGAGFPRGGGRLTTLMRIGAGRNPRRIKRFINAYMIASSLLGDLDREEQLSLAKVLMIQLRFPEFYRVLQQDSRLLERVSAETDDEAQLGPFAKDEALRRFLEHTSNIDSRGKLVRRWIRVTDPFDPEIDAGDDSDE